MMKKFLFYVMLLQGVLMSAILEKLTVNGVEIPIIFEEERLLPIVSMQVVFRYSGSLADGKHPGLAKFSARMMNEGTKKLGSIGFAKALEEKAISLSSYAGRETFVFELSSLKSEFDDGIKLFANLLKDPNLTKESFKKVQTTTIGSLMRKESDYDYQASLLLKRDLFEDTPLEKPSDGRVDDIKALKLSDVENFLKSHLVLKRAIIVMGGSLSIDEAKAYAKEALKSLSVGSSEPLPFFQASEKSKTSIEIKPTKQAYIYFGSPFNMRVDDPESYKAKVAAFILGEQNV